MNRPSFIVLPVIPPPSAGEATVLVAGDGFQGPFFKGMGYISLLCGSCQNLLAEGMDPGQIENIVLQCPKCQEHNYVISIPLLERFIEQVQAAPATEEMLERLYQGLSNAQINSHPVEKVLAFVEQFTPSVSTLKQLLVPKNAGEFYGMLAFIIPLLAWLRTMKPKSESPKIIINNYFNDSSGQGKK